jgi:phosphoribosylanthranilate isomerase
VKPLVKICGITSEADASASIQAGADFLGFIFYGKSPRYVLPSTAAQIIRHLPAHVTPVGVVVNERRDMINAIIEETGVRAVQLSGDEQPAECTGYDVPIIKAFRFRNGTSETTGYEIWAALLDGAHDGQYGGTGMLPDLAIAHSMAHNHRLFVAGGITPDNVLEVVRRVEPFALDINSGIEISPGKKNHRKLRQLFQQLSELN